MKKTTRQRLFKRLGEEFLDENETYSEQDVIDYIEQQYDDYNGHETDKTLIEVFNEFSAFDLTMERNEFDSWITASVYIDNEKLKGAFIFDFDVKFKWIEEIDDLVELLDNLEKKALKIRNFLKNLQNENNLQIVLQPSKKFA